MSPPGHTPYLVLLLLLATAPHVQGGTYNDSNTLITDLLTNYNTGLRPLQDQTSTMYVNFTVMPTSKIGIDVPGQVIAFNNYILLSWVDEKLTWSPADYGGLTTISIMSDQLWKPSLTLANNLHDEPLGKAFPIEVLSTGYVAMWIFAPITQTCKLDLTKFPYDKHDCEVVVLGHGFGPSMLKMVSTMATPLTDLFVVDGEWDIIHGPITYRNYSIPNGMLVGAFLYHIQLNRLPGYFLLNLMFPTCALSFLNILVFVLPADSGEKIGYSITVLLAVMFQLAYMQEFLPTTSEVVPLVTQYITILTFISICSVIATVFILIIHHQKRSYEQKKGMMLRVMKRLTKGVSGYFKPTPTKGALVTDDSKISLWATKKHLNKDKESKSQNEVTIENGNPLLKWKSKTTNVKPAQTSTSPVSEISIVNVENTETAGSRKGSIVSFGSDSGIMEPQDGLDRKRQFRGHSKSIRSRSRPYLYAKRRSCEYTKIEKKENGSSEEDKDNIMQQLSNNIDTKCFIVFVTVWSLVTVGYMTALNL